MIKKIIASPFFVFPAVSCIFFWPLAFSLLSLKNDALTYYYPIRTLISDALNNGELPLWTAFINMGYPIHGDLQSGAWNPILWLFSFITGYSLTAFHFEFLFYTSFAGIGFFYLSKEFGVSRPVAFAIAFAYQFSGFILDSAQFFTCISSACYLPFVLLFFRKTLLLFQWKDALYSGIFLSLFLTGGYPSLFVFTCYLLLAYLLFFFFKENDKKTFTRKLILPSITMVFSFGVLSLPAILSFVEYLPLIKRGTGLSIAQASENAMHPGSLASLIAPFANTAHGPDPQWSILMQCIYIGILPLLFLIFALIPKPTKNKKEFRFFLVAACFFLLLSWGDFFFVHKLAYYAMPLVDNFRHPGISRLFSIFLLLLAVNCSLTEWKEGNFMPDKIQLKLTTFLMAALFVWGIVLIAINIPVAFSGFRSNRPLLSIFKQLSFSERYLIQLPFLLVVLWLFSRFLKQRKQLYWLPLLVLFDLFINVQLQVPVTVAGARRFPEIEKQLGRNPVKFPLPENQSIKENSINSLDSLLITGSKIPFLKKIGRNDYFISPGNLSLQDSFYASPIRDIVFEHSLLYEADSVLQNTGGSNPIYVNRNILSKQIGASTLPITPVKFSANRLEASLDSSHSFRLIFLQNYYPGWKATIDGKAKPIERVNITFMSVNVPKGSHQVSFIYKPTIIIYAFWLAAIGWCFILLLTMRNLFLKQLSAIRRRET